MPKEEAKKQPEKARPPIAPQSIGKRKSLEIDSLQPTPERKAKTGAKSWQWTPAIRSGRACGRSGDGASCPRDKADFQNREALKAAERSPDS